MLKSALMTLALSGAFAATAYANALTQPLTPSRYEILLAQDVDDMPDPRAATCLPERECHILIGVRYEGRLEPVEMTLRIGRYTTEIAFHHPIRRIGIGQSERSWIAMLDDRTATTITIGEYAPQAAVADGEALTVPLALRQPIGVFAKLRLSISPKF